MNKIFGFLLVGSSLILSACGGSSDSSSSNNSSFDGNKTLSNGNKYLCPSKETLDSCTDDTSCTTVCSVKEKKVVINAKTYPDCTVEGKAVTGSFGQTCSFKNPEIFSNKKMNMTCVVENSTIILNAFHKTTTATNTNTTSQTSTGNLVNGSMKISNNGHTLNCK